MFFHPKGAPALEGKGGSRRAEISAAATWLLQEQREKTKLSESGDHALGSHCSRVTPNSKPYLGGGWNKPFHSPSEGKGREKGMGFFAVNSNLLLKANLRLVL